jgi:hypothetical protein
MLNSIFWKSLLILSLLFVTFSTNVFAATNQELYVEDAFVTCWANEFEITFSNEISEESIELDGSLFRIESIDSPEDSYEVIEKSIDSFEKKVMILTLNRDFVNWERYKVTVLKIVDIYWQNIVNWVDSEAEFSYLGLDDRCMEDNWLNSANEVDENVENVENVENIDNNNVDVDVEGDLWGVSLNAWDVENQVLVVAEDNSKLPVTWPEHILLLILALIFWGWLFIYKYRKI